MKHNVVNVSVTVLLSKVNRHKEGNHQMQFCLKSSRRCHGSLMVREDKDSGAFLPNAKNKPFAVLLIFHAT